MATIAKRDSKDKKKEGNKEVSHHILYYGIIDQYLEEHQRRLVCLISLFIGIANTDSHKQGLDGLVGSTTSPKSHNMWFFTRHKWGI